MKLRPIDIAAAFAAILLVKLTNVYTQGSESMEASIQLAFYSVWTSHVNIPDKDLNKQRGDSIRYDVARPVLLDVDGDGTSEALVVPLLNDTIWELQVLDLTPLRDKWAKEVIPFVPKKLFTSTKEDHRNHKVKAVPVKFTTGQLILVEKQEDESETKKNDETNSNDTSQFYCGIDWHDAHTSCAIPCPNMSECPQGQFCFADTGCNRKESQKKTVSSIGGVLLEELTKTPKDGLPTVVSVWSDGRVILHSIFGKLGEPLEMVELWNVKILSMDDENRQDSVFIEFLELDVILDSEFFGTFGTVFLAATYKSQIRSTEGNSETVVNDLYIALDAHDGTIIWRHNSKDQNQKGKNDKNSEVKTLSSIARRRSRASLYYPVVDNAYEDFEHSEDCFHHFHSNVMDVSSHVLPHSFWDNQFRYGSIAQDTKLLFSHFDRKRNFRITSNRVEGKSFESKESRTKNGWIFRVFDKTKGKPEKGAYNELRNLRYGRPNVLLHHNHLGVTVLALKNGKQVCHLALSDHKLYGDLENDGIIDQLQVIFDVQRDLASMPPERTNCEASLQSGINPAKDGSSVRFPLCEHYTTHIKALQSRHHLGDITSTESAPPLLIEGFDDLISTDWTLDIVYALNHGVLKRFNVHGGLIWSALGEIPSWDNSRSVLLDRISFEGSTTHGTSVSAIRPIILSGDDSFALFSSKHGRLLDKTSFPQLSVSRPLLGDFDGDGTSDVIIFTTDGVLGFKIDIYSNKMTFIHVMNGLLFVMVTISVAYASSNKNGKRLKQL